MSFIAIFEARVAGEEGLYLPPEQAEGLAPIEIVVDGYPIRIIPVIGQRDEYEYDDDGRFEYQIDGRGCPVVRRN
jgi:hypothetical protein